MEKQINVVLSSLDPKLYSLWTVMLSTHYLYTVTKTLSEFYE